MRQVTIVWVAGLMASLTAAAMGAQAETRPLQYAPDRKVDITHVKLDVTPNFKDRTVVGTVTIEFTPIAKPLSEIKLDAVDLNIYRVWSDAGLAGWTSTKEDLTVTFEPAIEPGAKVRLNVLYDAQPEQGLYFRTPELGYPAEDMHCFSQGESREGRYWFPCYDYPNERFSTEVICHVPPDMTVVSNGRLVAEQTDAGTGLKAVHWRQDKPHVNYLIALVAGTFAKIEARHGSVPLAFYTPASQIGLAAASFEGTDDMVSFFEQETGVPYPWDKYDQVAVDDFVAGGMENTSLTILTSNTLFAPEMENIDTSTMLVAHELAHQWFGDYVTCKDWANVWLNEGFATYYENLYQGHRFGPAEFSYGMFHDSLRILADTEATRPIFDRAYKSESEQFDYRAYQKGGWVLHMLRARLGDDVFRRCIRTYLTRYALSTVTTDDLRGVAEEVSGQSLDRFFDQWIFGPGVPKLKVTYTWSDKTRLAKVSVRQTQADDGKARVFEIPTQVRFMVHGRPVDRDLLLDQPQQDFYFPLAAEPNIVRFDPKYTVLASVTFDVTKAMLYEQLRQDDDAMGQVLACQALAKEDDKKTVEHLAEALNGAAFYGVRQEAAEALRKIHSDEAFDSLAKSIKQPDARVRRTVVGCIGGFYRSSAMTSLKAVLQAEKNPVIIAEALQGLGRYADPGVQAILRRSLESESFRNQIAGGAVGGITTSGDPVFVPDVLKLIRNRQQQLTANGLARALDCLAVIDQDQQDRTEARQLLEGFVNSPKRSVQTAAVRALGTLRDSRALAVLETFAQSREQGDRLSDAAERAIARLRLEKPMAAEEVGQLRQSVEEIKKENKDLREKVDGLEKRLDAMSEKAKPSKSDSTRAEDGTASDPNAK
jgi:aminopeptidase N